MTEKTDISRIEAKNYRFVAGIDPGVNTGFAIYSRDTKKLTYDTRDFWKTYHFFEALAPLPKRILVIIETPKKSGLYERQAGEQGARRREKIASNVGSNAREAELLADGIEALGYTVRRVTPSRTKWTAADLKRYTGLDIRVSQHVRDAIALCYGV